MENRINILNELKELSPLIAGIKKVNVFTVPNGYFVQLDENVLKGIKEEGGLLSSIKNQSSMQVPQGYFESLADNILSKIKLQDSAASELRDLSPMLYSIQNKNVFTVPQGYFETLPANILNNVAPQQAKLVTMKKRTVTILIKYAVAAVFTGVMALGVYKFTNKNSIVTSSNNAITNVQYEGLKIAKENRFEEEFAKVTDEEIVNFLTKDGVDVEAAVAITQMQDKIDTDEASNDKAESTEIDDLLNQLDENKTMN